MVHTFVLQQKILLRFPDEWTILVDEDWPYFAISLGFSEVRLLSRDLCGT